MLSIIHSPLTLSVCLMREGHKQALHVQMIHQEPGPYRRLLVTEVYYTFLRLVAITTAGQMVVFR